MIDQKHKKSCIFPIQIAVDWGDTSDLMSHSDRGLDEQQLNGGVHVAWLPGTFCTKKPMELTELTMKNGGVNQWNMEIYGNECVFFQTSGISSNSKRGHDGNGSSIGKQFPRFGVFPRSRLNGILWIYRIPFPILCKAVDFKPFQRYEKVMRRIPIIIFANPKYESTNRDVSYQFFLPSLGLDV